MVQTFFIFLPCLAILLPKPRNLHFFNESMCFVISVLPFDVGERCEIHGDEVSNNFQDISSLASDHLFSGFDVGGAENKLLLYDFRKTR